MNIIRIFHLKQRLCNKTTDMSKSTMKDMAKVSMKASGSTNVMKLKRMCLRKGMERCMSGKEEKIINLKGTTREQ